MLTRHGIFVFKHRFKLLFRLQNSGCFYHEMNRDAFISYLPFMKKDLLSRITVNPEVCHGKPTIRNKRYTVDLILDLLSAGSTHQEILEDYPNLEEADILACLAYASKLASYSGFSRISV